MGGRFFKLFIVGILFFLLLQNISGQYTKILDFGDSTGSYPKGSLVNSGDTLFGVVEWGKPGTSSGGLIYRINTDRTGYKILYDFKGTAGYNPLGAMVLKSNALYGATYQGGTQYKGNLFRINTDGSNFESFFSFHDSLGERPVTPFLILGDTIFGVTTNGGKYNQGVLYRLGTDGSGYKKLKDYYMQQPTSVIYFDHYLYGVLIKDYENNSIIYRIKTDGTGYEVLREFNVGLESKPIPKSPLLVVDSIIYGGACAGNSYSNIYKIKPDGSGYEVIHSFGNLSNIILPTYTLTYWNGYLLGNGSNDNRIFKVSKDGTEGEVIYSFNNQEGYSSYGSLLLHNGSLYGTTIWGGLRGNGALYKYNLNSAVPSAQSESIEVTDLLCNQMKISWKRGNGNHCVVFMRAGNGNAFSIPDNTQYTADYRFGKGSPLNSEWFCIYNGKDSSVTVTGTQPSIQYQVKVCEYNVALLKDEKYNIQTTPNNPRFINSPKCRQTIFLDLLPISTYGDPAFFPEGVSGSGMKVRYSSDNTDVAYLQGELIKIKNPGIANITATQEGNEFYFPADAVIRQLKVDKALLKVTAVDTSRNDGEPNPLFRLRYSGFVSGENADVILSMPVVSCGASADSPSGKYEILVSGGEDEHYNFKYYNGILTIKLSTIAKSLNESHLRFYPNPADSYLTIETDDNSPCLIQISDLSGRILINTRLSNYTIDISSLPRGFYLLKAKHLNYKFAKN